MQKKIYLIILSVVLSLVFALSGCNEKVSNDLPKGNAKLSGGTVSQTLYASVDEAVLAYVNEQFATAPFGDVENFDLYDDESFDENIFNLTHVYEKASDLSANEIAELELTNEQKQATTSAESFTVTVTINETEFAKTVIVLNTQDGYYYYAPSAKVGERLTIADIEKIFSYNDFTNMTIKASTNMKDTDLFEYYDKEPYWGEKYEHFYDWFVSVEVRFTDESAYMVLKTNEKSRTKGTQMNPETNKLENYSDTDETTEDDVFYVPNFNNPNGQFLASCKGNYYVEYDESTGEKLGDIICDCMSENYKLGDWVLHHDMSDYDCAYTEVPEKQIYTHFYVPNTNMWLYVGLGLFNHLPLPYYEFKLTKTGISFDWEHKSSDGKESTTIRTEYALDGDKIIWAKTYSKEKRVDYHNSVGKGSDEREINATYIFSYEKPTIELPNEAKQLLTTV